MHGSYGTVGIRGCRRWHIIEFDINEIHMSKASFCLFCDFFWSSGILVGCTYVVFWMNQSGWWYLLAIVLCGMWDCKPYRSAEQIAADVRED